mgnify:CR=1 FL=1
MLELSNPHTGESYANAFRISEDQRLRTLERISSGEKQQMYKQNTMTGGQAFNIGMLGETVFEDLFPCSSYDTFSIKELINSDSPPHVKEKQFYADYVIYHPELKKDLHIDVKTRQFKKGKFKNPASWFKIYVTDKIRKNIENGYYQTDFYAFVGVHEDEKNGWFYGLISPKVFFLHAVFVDQFWDGARCISDSWCIDLETAYKLSEHKKLNLHPSFTFEQRNDDESFWLVRKGTEVTIKIFHQRKPYGLKVTNLKEDHIFKSKNTHLEHIGNGKYKILFHTNPSNPEEKDYHMLVNRENVEFKYGA